VNAHIYSEKYKI